MAARVVLCVPFLIRNMCYMRRATVLNEVDAKDQKFKDMLKSQRHVVAWHDSCSGFEESWWSCLNIELLSNQHLKIAAVFRQWSHVNVATIAYSAEFVFGGGVVIRD